MPVELGVLGSPCALMTSCSREGTGTAGSLSRERKGMLSLKTGSVIVGDYLRAQSPLAKAY